MAIKLGSIIVDFLANTAGFQSGLTKASYEAKKTAKEIHSAFGEMGSKIGESFNEVLGQFGPLGQAFGKLGGAVNEAGGALAGGGSAIAAGAVAIGALGAAAIGGAVALGELAKGGAELVERFSLISQKTGISIRDLQGFEAVGKTVGVSLEDMVTGMRKFDQALTGVGKNAAAGAILRELGVDAKTNKEALLQTADAFKAMEDGPEKAALAVQLFGKSGLNMIPFLDKGAEGIKEFNDLVDKFGPKIGKDAVDANEKYKKSVVQLDLEWQNFKVTIEQAVLPALTKLNSVDWGATWAGFKGALGSGPLGAAKAVADLQVQRAAAADEAHKEADAEDAKRSAIEKQVALQEASFETLKAGGTAAYALEQAREKMAAEIAVHHFDAATDIFNQLPALQEAADLEAQRVARAKQLAATYKAISDTFASGNFSRPNVPSKPLDPSQSKGLESLFGKQPGKDPLEGAPDLGKPSYLTDMAQVPELGKMLSVGADYLQAFNDKWRQQSRGTEQSINDDYNAQLAGLRAMLALGEVSESDAKDVYLKIQQERVDGLKRLREQNGATTFQDAWSDMFTKMKASGQDFAGSLVQDIGGAIEGLNQQLVQFIATGKGMSLQKIGQSLTESITSSVLKKGESSFLGFLGLGDGTKPDGSTQTNALWVQFATEAGLPGIGGIGNLPLPNLGVLGLGGIGGGASGRGLFSTFGKMAGSIGGGIGSAFSSIGSFFGGFLADGGDVTPGKAYIVGEERPELFMPRSAGKIIPSVSSGNQNYNQTTVQMHIHGVSDADSFKKSQAQISSATLKPTTVRAAKSHLRTHVIPALGDMSLTAITTRNVQAFVSALAAKGLSSTTVGNVVQTLAGIMNTAKAWKFVPEVFDRSELSMPSAGEKKEERFFTAEQVRQIVEASEEPYSTLWALIGLTGARAGEILGLKTTDIDFDKRLIRIRRTLDHATRTMQAPKSKSSSADLPMPELLEKRLRNFLAKHWRKNEADLLFCNSKGKPMQRDKVAYKLQATLESLGIKKAALHAFRHMAASELLEQGASPSVVQRQMRHSDSRITLEKYGHVIGDAQRRAVDSLAGRVLG
jgi:integrase